jgi:hypothetical protein
LADGFVLFFLPDVFLPDAAALPAWPFWLAALSPVCPASGDTAISKESAPASQRVKLEVRVRPEVEVGEVATVMFSL